MTIPYAVLSIENQIPLQYQVTGLSTPFFFLFFFYQNDTLFYQHSVIKAGATGEGNNLDRLVIGS